MVKRKGKRKMLVVEILLWVFLMYLGLSGCDLGFLIVGTMLALTLFSWIEFRDLFPKKPRKKKKRRRKTYDFSTM